MSSPVCGNIQEIFSGIQGEGARVGERQIFVRLSGCNLECGYCDTEFSRGVSDVCRAEKSPGSREFEYVNNPVSAGDAVLFIERLRLFSVCREWVSITGGEPLVQADFLEAMLPNLDFYVMLETNGTLPDELVKILRYIDSISMDVKLKSASGNADLMVVHGKFLEAASEKDVCVKIVLTSDTSESELLEAAKMIEETAPDTPLILQPVTPVSEICPPSPAAILDWQVKCLKLLRNVRVIPQCHKAMGQM